jgi:two-component sensor histidine kinase
VKFAEVKTVASTDKKIIPITSEDKPDISEELQQKWQKILDLAAKLIGVPSGLITRLHERDLEVFLSSKTDGNIFEPQLKLELGLGWYCENVAGTRNQLVLQNALTSDEWKEDNPSIPFNMVSYMGMPILWPDGEVFGTFCMLDNKENKYSALFQDLLSSLREIIQNDLKSIILYRKAQNDLQNKEIQIKEVHHRVKNHFNLLISTLSLQSLIDTENKNIESIVADIQSRISAISLIHDNLYHSTNSEMFSLGNYLTELGKHILKTLQKRFINYSCQSDEIVVSSNISVPCGLILNELITNSLKYAFEKTYQPAINVFVHNRGEGIISILYKDNGTGISEGFSLESSNSLGMLLIKQSVLQLNGSYEIKNDNGFVFEMNFKI